MNKLELFQQVQTSHGELMPPEADDQEVQLLQGTDIDLYVSPEQVDALIEAKENEFDKNTSAILKSKLQKDVLQAIASPLGLGQITAAFDKEGGAVDTIHNVRQGVMTESAKEKIASEEPYNSDLYHKHENYIQKTVNTKKPN